MTYYTRPSQMVSKFSRLHHEDAFFCVVVLNPVLHESDFVRLGGFYRSWGQVMRGLVWKKPVLVP
jgi:hypothetical protein